MGFHNFSILITTNLSKNKANNVYPIFNIIFIEILYSFNINSSNAIIVFTKFKNTQVIIV